MRTLHELPRKAVEIKTVREWALTNVISRQSPPHAAVSRICSAAETLPDSSTSFGDTGSPMSPVNGLVAAAKRTVEEAAANLAAYAAAAAVALAASHSTSAGSPAPLPPSAPKELEPIRLQLSGPLRQVPESVRRIFHQYEEKHVRQLLARQTLLRWWMLLWL